MSKFIPFEAMLAQFQAEMAAEGHRQYVKPITAVTGRDAEGKAIITPANGWKRRVGNIPSGVKWPEKANKGGMWVQYTLDGTRLARATYYGWNTGTNLFTDDQSYTKTPQGWTWADAKIVQYAPALAVDIIDMRHEDVSVQALVNLDMEPWDIDPGMQAMAIPMAQPPWATDDEAHVLDGNPLDWTNAPQAQVAPQVPAQPQAQLLDAFGWPIGEKLSKPHRHMREIAMIAFAYGISDHDVTVLMSNGASKVDLCIDIINELKAMIAELRAR